MKRILILSFMVSVLFTLSAGAQSLRATVKQIKSLRNVSFTEVVKFKFSFQDEFSLDTLNSKMFIVTGEPQIGGYYKIDGHQQQYLFDGNKSISLNLKDKTYRMSKQAIVNQFTRSLLYWQKQMEAYLKSPAKIKQLKDTMISKVVYNYFMVTRKDTVQKNEHIHDLVYLVTDKRTYLPVLIKSDFKGFANDGALIGAIEQHSFTNYKLNQKNFPDLSETKVPDGFKLPVKSIKPVPLAIGTKAPQIDLQDATGNTFDLGRLKNKTVLLNFALLGCPHCINSAQMLNRLYDKFKGHNFEIISIYQLKNDHHEGISKFDKKFNINYPSYTTGNDAEKIYRFQGYPYFFLIDKQGHIAQAYEGFYLDLEKELTDKIESIK
ncbi:TlpA family protein disulfide reductase [Pedobacter nutrimenti]|uniref:Peroxiredoxin n=1 Tax=Pedobacter nutrimenti TaxID=1241337 RepID=A0A318UES1_9SPHI|nr:TlpA disulfide reductase family protein [Pedobacter nutrimenti]PYF74846.1 peroxiredoxin [Pedobacter nutrimenti]